MTILLAILAGVALSGQVAGPATEPATPLPDVNVIAPVDQGEVMLECRVSTGGSLRGCIIISETPPGQGFGEAALDQARRAQLSPRVIDRSTPGEKIRFTLRFQLAD